MEKNRTISPSADAMTGAPGPSGADTPDERAETQASPIAAEELEGQLGPDEISEPDEVVKNNEAKIHP